MKHEKSPSHSAYIVTEAAAGGKAQRREIGAIWPHQNGAGFDLVIFDRVSVSGRIVCTERKEKAAK